MKNFLVLICLSIFCSNCVKEPSPKVGYGNVYEITTGDITGVSFTSAICGGEISSYGNGIVVKRGVCFRTTPKPTVTDNITDDGYGTGSFTSNLSGLSFNTRYYVRAYETLTSGTVYGLEKSFITLSPSSPTVTSTSLATSITRVSAISGGTISSDNGAAVTARGVCWSTNASPTILNNKSTDGIGIGTFISNISGLSASTTYHVRAYATNVSGTSYGPDISFTTSAAASPTVSATTTASSISWTSAIGGGTISSDNGSAVTSRGVCWNTSPSPSIFNSKTIDGSGIGTFSSALSGLTASTTYYVRAYATNSVNTSYGPQVVFNTPSATLPTVSATTTVSSISWTSATGGGTISSDNGSAVTSRGVCWNTSPSPSIFNSKTIDGSGIGTFSSALTGLTASTTYYVRAYATNSVNTAYGPQVVFNTPAALLPTVSSTTAITSITRISAIGGGNISSDNGSAVTARGVCWSNTTSSPTIANSKTNNGLGIGSFSSSLTSLLPSTTYYVRAYATNGVGTAYGPMRSFTTLN